MPICHNPHWKSHIIPAMPTQLSLQWLCYIVLSHIIFSSHIVVINMHSRVLIHTLLCTRAHTLVWLWSRYTIVWHILMHNTHTHVQYTCTHQLFTLQTIHLSYNDDTHTHIIECTWQSFYAHSYLSMWGLRTALAPI